MSHPRASSLSRVFERFAQATASWAGSHWAFLIALSIVAIWGAAGPLFHFCDTWQLVINTGTTIVTFLMVFLIQRSQNKDSLAIQLKLNELIAAISGASNRLINVEDLSEEEEHALHKLYEQLAAHGKLKAISNACSVEEVQELKEDVEELKKQLKTEVNGS